MKKSYVVLLVAVAFVLGAVACSFLNCGKSKVAVVDIATVVNNSEQVRALKDEQTAKAQALGEWLKGAQADVEKQKDQEKKDALLQQYNNEFAQKREVLAREYGQELQNIDQSITATIVDEAKKKGYNLVIAKGLVLFGGDDITEAIAKEVK